MKMERQLFELPFSMGGRLLVQEVEGTKMAEILANRRLGGDEGGGSSSKGDWSTIIASRPGGQGRTTLTQVLNLGLAFAGIEATLVSTDGAEGFGLVARSKLAMVEKGVIDLQHFADLKRQLKDPNVAAELFDTLMDVRLERDNVLVDVGANTVDAVFSWAQNCRLDSALGDRKFNLLVPTTGGASELEEALRVLKVAETGWVPIHKRAVAFVMIKDHWDKLVNPAKKALVSYCETNDVAIVNVPVNAYLAFSEVHQIPYLDFWNMTAFDYRSWVVAGGGNISLGLAGATLVSFGSWIGEVVGELADAGLAPKVTVPKKIIGRSADVSVG